MSDREVSLGRQFAAGSAWAFAGKVVAVGAAVAVNALLARLLDPAAFGVYILAASIVAVAAIVASLGLNSAVVRLLGESEAEKRQPRSIVKQCLFIGVLGASAAAMLLAGPPGRWLARQVFESELLAACLGWMSIWLVALTVQMLIAEAHRGLKDIRTAAIIAGPLAGVGLVVMLVAAYLFDAQMTPQAAIALAAIASLAVLPIGMLLLLKKTAAAPSSAYLPAGYLLSLALPMLITNVTLVVLNQADLWIVGIFLEKDRVAVYGAALQLASLITVPLLVLNAVVPPHIAENHRLGRHKRLEDALRRATGVAAYLSIAGFMIYVLFSTWVLEVIYGDYYRQAGSILIVIAIGRLVNVLAGPCGTVLMMTGFQHVMMWVNIVGGLVTVVSMAVVVGKYGLLGVASVAAVMMIAQNATLLWLARTKTGIWTHAQLSPKALLRR